MAAMMCPLPLLLLLIDNGITDSPAVDIISVDSGGAIRLRSDLTEAEQKLLHDLRWKHANLLLVLKDNMTKCPNGRCTLLPDGSLSYSRTETQDSGAYSMQAFDKDGKRFKMKEILLRVDSSKSRLNTTSVAALGKLLQQLSGFTEHSSSRVAAGSLTTGCFLLLGFTVTFFIIKRKRARLSRTTGKPTHSNPPKGDS